MAFYTPVERIRVVGFFPYPGLGIDGPYPSSESPHVQLTGLSHLPAIHYIMVLKRFFTAVQRNQTLSKDLYAKCLLEVRKAMGQWIQPSAWVLYSSPAASMPPLDCVSKLDTLTAF